MKSKLEFYGSTVIAVILLILGVYSYQVTKTLKVVKKDKARIETNFFNANQELDSVKDKNGDLVYNNNELKLTVSEFSKTNIDVLKKLDDLGVKVKNLERVSTVSYTYNYNVDSAKIQKLNDSTYRASHKDSWINLSEIVTLKKNRTTISVDSIHMILKDSLTIVDETIFKGWWFWRKPIETKIHLTSENPYLTLDKMKTIKFTKK